MCVVDQAIEGGERKDLALGRHEHVLHVRPAHAEAAAIDAGDQLERLVTVRRLLVADRREAKNTRDLVPHCAVVRVLHLYLLGQSLGGAVNGGV